MRSNYRCERWTCFRANFKYPFTCDVCCHRDACHCLLPWNALTSPPENANFKKCWDTLAGLSAQIKQYFGRIPVKHLFHSVNDEWREENGPAGSIVALARETDTTETGRKPWLKLLRHTHTRTRTHSTKTTLTERNSSDNKRAVLEHITCNLVLAKSIWTASHLKLHLILTVYLSHNKKTKKKGTAVRPHIMMPCSSIYKITVFQLLKGLILRQGFTNCWQTGPLNFENLVN